MKAAKIRRMLTGNVTWYINRLNVNHNSVYRWKDLPKKYIRPTIEFLDILATDLQDIALELGKELKKEEVKKV